MEIGTFPSPNGVSLVNREVVFCDACGVQLQTGSRFCGFCGKAFGLSAVPRGADGRLSRHLQLLTLLWFAISAFHLIGGIVLLVLVNTLFRDMAQLPVFVQAILSTAEGWLLLKPLVGFAAGWGLLERERWARPLTLVLGFIELVHVPFGTALGIYTLWVLLAPNAEREYQELARAA